MKRLISVGVLGLGLAAGLQAQDPTGFSASLNYVLGFDGLKEVTNSGAFGGVTGDFAYTGMLANSGVPFRASFAINYLPGCDKDDMGKVNLMGAQVGGDLLIKLGSKDNLNLVTGITLNKWRVAYHEPDYNESETIKGIKFGARLGIEYRVNKNWSMQAMVQAIELGAEESGFKGINPSWFQFGARFHF